MLEQIEVQEREGNVVTQAVWPMGISVARKSYALDGIQYFVDLIRRAGGRANRLHSDEACEFWAYPVKRRLKTQAAWQSYTAGDDPRANGLAEAATGVYKNKIQTNLLASGFEHWCWPYVVNYVRSHYIRRRSIALGRDIMKPDMTDQFMTGQELIVKGRKWKNSRHRFIQTQKRCDGWGGRKDCRRLVA